MGLKVAEAGAFLGIPFGMGKLVSLCPAFIKWLEIEGTNFWRVWAIGFFSLIMLSGVAMAVTILILFVLKNWEWAE